VQIRQGDWVTGAGDATGTAAFGGRAAWAAADEPPRFRLGEAAGRAGAAGSRVGGSIRGSGVESGSVAATPLVAVAIGEPPNVTMTGGVPASAVRPAEPAPVGGFTMEQPVVTSKATPIVALSQR
jgi:hypothetical protein